jgi:glutamyl-tRNA reductase
VAVDLAGRVVGNLKGCRMLVIGAGEAGRLVAKAASDRGVSQIVVASRTQERASNLTEMLGGIPISINNLVEELDTCNIIVTCADTPHYILDVPQVEAAMRRRPEHPLVIIDIAVPRNVEPAVTQIKNVFLYNIDDLSRISEQNRRQRQSEVRKAGKIISAEMAKFVSWWRDFKVRPLIRAMMSKAEEIRRSHLDRTVKKLSPLSDEERYSLEMMTKAIVAKILKDPIHNLKANGHSNRDYAGMVKELFQLNEESYR